MATTAGFDLLIQLSETAVDRILEGAYLKGNLPNKFSQRYDPPNMGIIKSVKVDFDPPTMSFSGEEREQDNLALIRYPLTAQVSLVSRETVNIEADVNVWAEISKGVCAYNGKNYEYVRLKFRGMDDDRFTLTVKEAEYKLYEAFLAESVKKFFKDWEIDLPLTPPVEKKGPKIAYFDFCPYDDKGSKNLDGMMLFANVAGNDERPTVPSARQLSPIIYEGEDFAVAISKELFEDTMAEKKFSSPDDSVSLSRPELTLRDGYIKIRGSATKYYDIIITDIPVKVSYSGKLKLGIGRQGQLTTHPYDLNVDVPWWASAFMFINRGIKGMLAGPSIEDIFRNFVASKSGEALSGFSLFSAAIPTTTGTTKTPTIVVQNKSVRVKPDALILSGPLFVLVDEALGTFPANTETREVHKKGGCVYQTWIHKENLHNFTTVLDALLAGYNGCFYCMRFYDTDKLKHKKKEPVGEAG